MNLMIKRNRPRRLPKSISSLVVGFKSAVNTKIDENELNTSKCNAANHFLTPMTTTMSFGVNGNIETLKNTVKETPKYRKNTLGKKEVP